MNTFGQQLRLTTFGESHGPAIGGVLDGLPETIVLPAMGKVEIDAVFKPAHNPGNHDAKLVITGLFNGRKSSRFVMPVNVNFQKF